ncbi:30S ribosomal protein S8 [Candidatus Uhrbacteria bacterium]|nr:30S ribosomal protein S8 [Candidatus Uhrbacteria bacterium]
MITDPISDMLTRIRNAQLVHLPEIVLPYSKIKFAIAKILEKEGYVGQVQQTQEQKRPTLKMELMYDAGRPKIQMIARVSRPSRRVYAKSSDLPRVLSDFGIAIISTPNGMMTNKEARARHLGGEVICEIS